MQRLRIECPRCESVQPFPRRMRFYKENVLEVYVRCTMCQWENHLGFTTPEIEVMTKRRIKARERYRLETKRLGQPSISTQNMVIRLSKRTDNLMQELDKKTASWTES